MQNTKSLYKTHEKKFNENLIYPMNSISSLFLYYTIFYHNKLFWQICIIWFNIIINIMVG